MNREDRNLASRSRERDDRAQLVELRRQIEDIDGRLVGLIAERVRIATRVGELKDSMGDAPMNPGQEAGVVRRAAELARSLGVSEDEVRQIFWLLIGMSRGAQIRRS